MKTAIKAYQLTLLKQQVADTKREELRAEWAPHLTEKVIIARDEDEESETFGEPTNWQDGLTTDKTVLKTFKKFQHQCEFANALSTKTNLTQRKMIKAIDEEARENNDGGD